MIQVVGVRFPRSRRIYFFDPKGKKYKNDRAVLVETVNGTDVARVVVENKTVTADDVVLPLRQIIRYIEDKDQKILAKNKRDEERMKPIFEKYAMQEKLDIRLVYSKYTFDRRHLLFAYTADDRVDFRSLVKKLASEFHVRIEMRQINTREKASMIGGIGPCGYELCCSAFLNDVYGSTIKMVKNQRLSLIPERISGLCGKLLCCLRYEDDVYTELAKILPDVNQMIETPDGPGKVTYVNVITQQIDVLFTGRNGVLTRKRFAYDTLKQELLK